MVFKIMPKKDYVLFLELIKEKVRKEYDGEIIEKLTLKIRYDNAFPMVVKCTECYRSVRGRGMIELPMESFGSENKRSVEIDIHLPAWD